MGTISNAEAPGDSSQISPGAIPVPASPSLPVQRPSSSRSSVQQPERESLLAETASRLTAPRRIGRSSKSWRGNNFMNSVRKEDIAERARRGS